MLAPFKVFKYTYLIVIYGLVFTWNLIFRTSKGLIRARVTIPAADPAKAASLGEGPAP